MTKQGTVGLTRTIAAAMLFGALNMTACGQQDAATGESSEVVIETETIQSSEGVADNMEVITELQITDIVQGDGATASAGQQVVVHYTGWLYDPGQILILTS